MKQSSFISIPFKIEGIHGGFSKAEGIAKFSSAGIVLEFEAKIFGLMKTGVKEALLPLAEIQDVRFKKGFFKYGATIEILLNSFAKLSELPYKDGRVSLIISRENHQKAEAAVAGINKYLEEYLQSLPPNQTSVSDLFKDESKELN